MEKEVLENLLKQNLSYGEISNQLNLGKTTIRYWAKKYNLESSYGKRTDNENCSICNEKLTGNQTKFCSISCKQKSINSKHSNYKAQQTRGWKRKKELIEFGGGKCENCGYCKNYAALEFHHRNPGEKNFQIDIRKCSNTKYEELQKEAAKCMILCANCHREHHHPQLEVKNLKGR